jgi:hypothetical protein
MLHKRSLRDKFATSNISNNIDKIPRQRINEILIFLKILPNSCCAVSKNLFDNTDEMIKENNNNPSRRE